MEEINAYKCKYCDKIYGNKKSCKSHEYRCYFNPKTRSCASCGFPVRKTINGNKSHMVINICLANVDITKHLKTKCVYYANINCFCDADFKNIVETELFDEEKCTQRAMKAIGKYIN